ncbi:hypothetical protein E4Z66_13370 [Aliishimia ponticola]|uniref:Argininosuccinate lyase n=1 Tax=Aliishimia ponticola TaxID=2499833 RepID=A0A4S4NA14_9RHOB|nr:hypothetical protein [Aliishimia ponticola]THH36049.1 hypothetical protein E4Z66_13370 [Aliishimia ponticola]
MTRLALALATVSLIAACGADGDPVKPTANLNVGVSTGGVHAGGSVGVRKGPWNLSLGRIF